MPISESELPEIDIFSDDFSRDPIAIMQQARDKSWVAKFSMGHAVLDFAAMKDILSDPRVRTPNKDITAMSGLPEVSAFARFNNHFLLALEGDDHDRMRKAVSSAFTPRAANKHRPFMRETINGILDDRAASGQCDFVDIASQYPITVMCRLLGVDAGDIPDFEAWLEAIGEAFALSPEVYQKIDSALENMFDYAEQVIEARLDSGEIYDDLLQSLLDLATVEKVITREELLVLVLNLLSAGYDTTKNQLILCMKVLLDRPDELEALLADPKRYKPFIDECLRMSNPIMATLRVANEDFEYRGAKFPKDGMIWIPLFFSGLGPEMNEEPYHFDAHRKGKRHLAFSSGIHVCLGMFLARALLEEGLPVILERMQNLKATAEPKTRPFNGIWAYSEMPISFDLLGLRRLGDD
ncbi:MAG: cytochrome P450 [Pseudomonadota bacterium]